MGSENAKIVVHLEMSRKTAALLYALDNYRFQIPHLIHIPFGAE